MTTCWRCDLDRRPGQAKREPGPINTKVHVALSWGHCPDQQQTSVGMGPRVRGDDSLRGLRWKSHWWRDAVAADIDAGGFQGAVFFVYGAEYDDLGARLHLGLIDPHESDDRRIRRHYDFLLAVLVLDQDVLAIGAR